MKNKIRNIFQLFFITAVLYVAIRPIFDKSYLSDFEQYCPFGGLSSFLSKLNTGAMACSMSETQIMLGLGLILGAVLIGKLFCGYVCPIGTVTEWLGRLGNRMKIRKELPEKADRYLRAFKYILLFITVYFTMTSNELFCKVFDPYFAAVNTFNNTDIILYYAIPAFVITIGGALVFRLFWCKYLCPLGAVSNIFMNPAGAGLIIILYIILNFFGAGINLIWLVGGLALIGMINELGFMRAFSPVIPRIRKTKNCSGCGICDAKCPQGIEISTVEVVNHIDCNLCSDCIYSCPKANTLTLGKKKNLKYLSPAALIFLIVVSFVTAGFYEFTTISVKWGEPSGRGAVYTQAGLKNIKCYGSSMALAGTLQSIEGIYGLDTYAKSNTVKIYYDPGIITESQVRETLFKPAKIEFSDPEYDSVKMIGVLEMGIYGLFDQIDFNNLYYTLKQRKGVYGFETQFGEPVITTIYFNSELISPEGIKKQIEKNFIRISESGNESAEIPLNFSVKENGRLKESITVHAYKKIMFTPYDEQFNDFENYKSEQLSVFKFHFSEADNQAVDDSLIYLVSHLSTNEGIVRFLTGYDTLTCGYIFFDPSQTSAESIKSLLTMPRLTVYVSDTETEEIKNPFDIVPEGEVLKATDVIME